MEEVVIKSFESGEDAVTNLAAELVRGHQLHKLRPDLFLNPLGVVSVKDLKVVLEEDSSVKKTLVPLLSCDEVLALYENELSNDDLYGLGKKLAIVFPAVADDSEVAKADIPVFTRQLVEALQVMHDDLGLIHGDVKRSNVLWDSQQKTVKLIDLESVQHCTLLEPGEKWHTPGLSHPFSNHNGTAEDMYGVGIILGGLVFDIPETARTNSTQGRHELYRSFLYFYKEHFPDPHDWFDLMRGLLRSDPRDILSATAALKFF